MNEPLRVLDLFSGIGGFSLGLERTGGFRTVAFCEIEPYCRAVLARHWPGIPCYEDVRAVTGDRLRADGISVDVICGGFPCQDISLAGKGAGLDGKRSGLWFEYRRLIEEVRPAWVVIENSIGLRTRGLAHVLQDLTAIGYDAEWSPVSACAVGFTHPRQRLFVVAYPACEWGQQCGRLQFPQSSDSARHLRKRLRQSEPPRVAHGVPSRVDRLRALGNAVVPQIPEIIGRAILEAEGGIAA